MPKSASLQFHAVSNAIRIFKSTRRCTLQLIGQQTEAGQTTEFCRISDRIRLSVLFSSSHSRDMIRLLELFYLSFSAVNAAFERSEGRRGKEYYVSVDEMSSLCSQFVKKNVFCHGLTVGASAATMTDTRDDQTGDERSIAMFVTIRAALQVNKNTNRKHDNKWSLKNETCFQYSGVDVAPNDETNTVPMVDASSKFQTLKCMASSSRSPVLSASADERLHGRKPQNIVGL